MAEFKINGGVTKEDLLSAIREIRDEIETSERRELENLNEDLKNYMLKVSQMPEEKQKEVFKFIDSIS